MDGRNMDGRNMDGRNMDDKKYKGLKYRWLEIWMGRNLYSKKNEWVDLFQW